MTNNLPAVSSRFTTPRVVASGQECWWRLGPNIRDRYTTAKAYGVADIRLCRDCGDRRDKCGHLTIVCAEGAEIPVMCVEHRVSWSLTVNLPKPLTHTSGVVSIDVLTEWPPMLPERTPWQQMTRRGHLEHPGEDMRKWRFDNPWD